MGYIGKKPTPVPLTASDVTDGIISNAKLAQDVISAETALTSAPADTDEFLLSDAGTLKRIDYSLIKGGGMYELIQTQTISSAVSSVDFTSTQMTTAHLDYLIIFSGIRPSADGASLDFLISSDGGSTFITTSSYFYGAHGESSSGVLNTQNEQSAAKIRLNTVDMGNGTGRNTNGIVEMYDPLNQISDNKFFTCSYRLANHDSNGQTVNSYGAAGFVGSGSEDTVFNGVRFLASSGNLDQGVFSIYGRKTS